MKDVLVVTAFNRLEQQETQNLAPIRNQGILKSNVHVHSWGPKKLNINFYLPRAWSTQFVVFNCDSRSLSVGSSVPLFVEE